MLRRDNTLRPPLRITELLQLTHLGIPLEHITWPRVTMTSDQWICIRHCLIGSNLENITVITVLNPHHTLPQTWKAVADCAQMNPSKPIIAVKDSPVPVKVFCRDARMKNAQLVRYVSDPKMKWFALSGLIAEVLSVELKKEQLVKYVWDVCKRLHIAERLSNVLKVDEA
ncbi:Clathrin heavy chain like protein [Argiope bruennichi]|uniref:Clathrin heavy chain like protein n=1 Tax=Argiope bruennichi TaxID=94029 RepID=A0A8T0E5N1_ARGBR|nr:Clathrin heavy chain like protein [Argiope bruennichi]